MNKQAVRLIGCVAGTAAIVGLAALIIWGANTTWSISENSKLTTIPVTSQMVVSQANFNTHPELSDTEFITGMIATYFGQTSTTSSQISAAQGAVTSSGRYGLYQSWITQNFAGNTDDPWFQQLPSWTPLALLGVGAVSFTLLVWFAWGDDIKRAFNKMKGSGSESND